MTQIKFAEARDLSSDVTFQIAYLDMNCPKCGDRVQFAVRRDDPLTMRSELDAMEKRRDRMVEVLREQKEEIWRLKRTIDKLLAN